MMLGLDSNNGKDKKHYNKKGVLIAETFPDSPEALELRKLRKEKTEATKKQEELEKRLEAIENKLKEDN